MLYANLSEIFFSLQGEGPLAGLPFLFIRFGGCNIRCDYCDTKWSHQPAARCRIKTSGKTLFVKNPVSMQTFRETLTRFRFKYVSFTGGEPLCQSGFIEHSLPLFKDKTLLMETNGTLPDTLHERLIQGIEYWSIDIKLPSVTGADFLENNRSFIKKAEKAGKLILKAVYSEKTTPKELHAAFQIARESFRRNRNTELIYQPMDGKKGLILGKSVSEIYKIMEKSQMRVRILPQIHKLMNIP